MNQSNTAIERAAQDYRDQKLADYLDDYDSDVTVFDEFSSLASISGEMKMERQITFQRSWDDEALVYDLFDVISDRLESDEDDQKLICSTFLAALFNADKGGAATDLAQSADLDGWIQDYFKGKQKQEKPYYMTAPNLDFLNVRSA
jgi:hypothetical protein